MKIQKVIIKGRLLGLNEYTKANRTNKYSANNLKRNTEMAIIRAIREAKTKPVNVYPIKLKIAWYEPNKRRDIDNITFAIKFIQDALKNALIIKDDSQKYINAISHAVKVDKERPRIEIEIIEGYENGKE